MNNSKNTFLLPLMLLSFMALGVVIGTWVTADNTLVIPGNPQQANFSKMQDIVDLIEQKYVDPIQQDKLFEQTITNMLHKLDPHSNYIPASEMKMATEQIEGKFGGVGIRFALIRDTLCVTHVIENSPSERAGVEAGDRIVKIDGTKAFGKKTTTDKIMGMLKGEENTPVDVTILRNKKVLTKRIIRGSIPIESIVCATMLDKQTGYIRLDQFSVSSATEFHNASISLLKKGMKKLVFDLRDNGGGVLGGATQIADEFLKDNLKIVEVKGAHMQEKPHMSSSFGILENMEVTILINSGSASASEILAGALQDNDRATIIGRRSFGKGLVQQDFLLKDGSDLRLVIARYYTPTGRCIQKPFDGNFENYYHDQEAREESGELFAPDTTLFVDSLKFKTPKGKIVYGGGGIMPDIFVPVDTLNSSWYYIQLRYSPAFQQFAFDYVQNKRHNWKSAADFNQHFIVTKELVNQFTAYAQKNQQIKRSEKDLKNSYALISEALKAEIARQLFLEQGYFMVTTKTDKEVQRALKFMQTGK